MKKTRKPRRKRQPLVTLSPTRKVEFPEVKGKTIEALKLYLEVDDTSLSIVFTDRTHLSLDLEPGLTVRAELSDWKTHNWRPIKVWPPLERASFWIEWAGGGKTSGDPVVG
jgi:hypothetical protein